MLETEPQIVEAYVKTGRAKLVFRHILDFSRSQAASEAAECAGAQGRFWAMHHILYEKQGEWASAGDMSQTFIGYAASLGLDTAAFGQCYDSHQFAEKVRADDAAAKAAGIRTRPTFDVNGRRVEGALPFAQFRRVIDAALE